MRRCNSLLAAVTLALAGGPVAAQERAEKPALALMGTIPIYWGEVADIGEVLAGEGRPHWARDALQQDFGIVPIDYLSAEALAPYQNLLLAQPRGLSAEENVALDAWVRAGGRLILFADPQMTGESAFPLGDRRRPQDVALLSPILGHWGLELRFDPVQPAGLRLADHFGDLLPVAMRGELRGTGAADDCTVPGDGLLAHCVIGMGQAMVVADAAMLDIDGPYPHAESALAWLTGHVFADSGDQTGNPVDSSVSLAESQPDTDSGAGKAAPERHGEHGEGVR